MMRKRGALPPNMLVLVARTGCKRYRQTTAGGTVQEVEVVAPLTSVRILLPDEIIYRLQAPYDSTVALPTSFCQNQLLLYVRGRTARSRVKHKPCKSYQIA